MMRKRRNEDLADAAWQALDDIRRAYRIHRKKRPVIELAVGEHLIYAYPYAGYHDSLSARSQKLLEREYQDAQAHHQIVVFVKDSRTRRLISLSIDEDPANVQREDELPRRRGGRSIRPHGKE